MKDEVFDKLSVHGKLKQIRKNQKNLYLYIYIFWLITMLFMTVLGASIAGVRLW